MFLTTIPQAEGAKTEEESDALADKFIRKDCDVDEFLESFMVREREKPVGSLKLFLSCVSFALPGEAQVGSHATHQDRQDEGAGGAGEEEQRPFGLGGTVPGRGRRRNTHEKSATPACRYLQPAW